jgi:hypothetical protein
VDVVARCLEQIPNTSLSPRGKPAASGGLPKLHAGQVTTIDTPHDDSVVYLLFPIPPISAGVEKHFQWDFLMDVLSAGELGSPLNRLVREDS